MSNRNKTKFRHIEKGTKKIIKVTEENGEFFIGNTNERAENKMMHHSQINRNGIKNNHEENDEWSDYAKTSEDF